MTHEAHIGAVRLGVNIDHVATIRNARGGMHPQPLRAAVIAARAGADGITAHLREDRRHIGDNDIAALRSSVNLPLNLEMAATAEMLEIALRHAPNACCLVPERREELTTEGGLDVASDTVKLAPFVAKLRDTGIRVSLFIDPAEAQIGAAAKIGVDIVELHTGTWCEAHFSGNSADQRVELDRLRQAACRAAGLGLEVHAGHGLTYDTVKPVAEIPQIVELNIGHFLIGEAIFCGLEQSIATMRRLMDDARGAHQS